jgi:predicted NBD/HSP70 family sugar kinase
LYTDITNVIQAAEQGEAGCIAALEHAGERLGLALAGLVNLFNPATIIIDGSVARAGDILLDPLKRTVASSSLPAAWKGTRIVMGELGPTAIALGTSLAVLDEVFSVHTHSIPLTTSGGDTAMRSSALSLPPFAPGKGRM